VAGFVVAAAAVVPLVGTAVEVFGLFGPDGTCS